MLSFSKIAALGALALATLTAAAPGKIDSRDLVARGDKKGDYKVYDYNNKDIDVEIELVVVIVEVDKKGEFWPGSGSFVTCVPSTSSLTLAPPLFACSAQTLSAS
jgi:hypothetical protein